MKRLALPSVDKRWLVAGVALAAVGGIGFGAGRMAAPKAPAPPAVAEAPAANKGLVVIDADRIAAAAIVVQPVSSGALASEIIAQANVVAEPSGQAVLTARATGSVSQIRKRIGDPVRAGEVLALVESREAAQIAAARSTASAKANLAGKVYARERRLYDLKVSARQDMETAQAELAAAQAEARAARTAMGAAAVSSDGRYLMVVSPITGRITASSASLGAYVQPDAELFRVVDPTRVQIEASVTAEDARRIHTGDSATLETGGGVPRGAVVRSVTPGVSTDTRMATVVLTLAPDGPAVQPGELVRARITTRQAAQAGVVLPEDAVQTVEGRDTVFVRTPQGFRAQAVAVGQRGAGRVQILSGLNAGDAIATKNAFLLKAELGKGGEDED